MITSMQKGLLVIISSPSGGGKDSVINALLNLFPNSARLTTTTSRTPREDDKQKSYYFVTKEEFESKIKNGEFLEYNIYAGNFYGSEKKVLEKSLSEHSVVFTQIEVNGKHNLDKLGIENFSIFLVPESMEILRHRIERRGGISTNSMNQRLSIAHKEIKDSEDYDFRITNFEGKLGETVERIHQIIKDELKKRATLDKSGNFS